MKNQITICFVCLSFMVMITSMFYSFLTIQIYTTDFTEQFTNNTQKQNFIVSYFRKIY